MRIVDKGIVLIAAPLLFFCGALASEFWLVNSEEQLYLAQERARRITATSGDLAARLLNCRSSVALYAWTRDPSYLVPLSRAEEEVQDELRRLRSLAEQDAVERQYVSSLEELSYEFLATCKRYASSMLSGKDAQLSSALNKQDLFVLHSIAAKVDAIRLRETYLTGGKPSELISFRKSFQSLMVCTVLLAIGTALSMAYFFHNQISSRLLRLSKNADLLAKERPLLQPLSGDDELAFLDQSFHTAAAALRQASALLKESELRLRMLINSMPVGVALVAGDGKVNFVNTTVESLTGLALDEMVDHEITEFFSRSGPVALEERSVFETELLSKDQAFVPVEVRCEQLKHANEPQLVLALTDVRQRREIEIMRQQFISMVTHDLKSPLTSISLVLQMLAYGYHGQLSDEAVQSVADARLITERLLRLVDELLLYDKIISGGLELRRQQVQINEIVEHSIRELQAFAAQNQIKIEQQLCDEIDLDGDRDRLVQVFVNLLTNAVKFSPPGTVVTVKVRKEAARLQVDVTDRGRGIPAEHLASIFDRYKQVLVADSKRGLGLGLPICKAIVEAHGGEIGVESGPESGSDFWFTLPLPKS